MLEIIQCQNICMVDRALFSGSNMVVVKVEFERYDPKHNEFRDMEGYRYMIQ